MKYLREIVFICMIFGISKGKDVDLELREDLSIGSATASYQVEGAWNIGGKSESVWDRFTHNNSQRIKDGSNGDTACNWYYKYREDVQHIKSIGLDFYRFSISWPRILPTGFTNVINQEGLQYYKNLTAELVANGIEPYVTLYHWDHPQVLEDMGGWMNELMVDWFVDYARIVFRELGDNVKIWSTINEPASFCTYGYDSPIDMLLAPGKLLNGTGIYVCGHNVLKAHALTYRMYHKDFYPTQQGQVGIVLHFTSYLPANSTDSGDSISANTAFQSQVGWMAHPIYVGDYPEVMKSRIAAISKAQGYSKSRLPELSDYWISTIKGTADYFGLNHYTSALVSPDPDEAMGIYNTDTGVIQTVDPSWPTTTTTWLYVNPTGFSYALRKIRDEYGNPPVRVMENGYPDDGKLDDYDRISYYHDYMKELLSAVKRDGCNVKSYAIWSLMDNFEWNSGYTVKFGIINVDFEDPNTVRTDKLSVSWWKNVLATRRLQPVPTKSHGITNVNFKDPNTVGTDKLSESWRKNVLATLVGKRTRQLQPVPTKSDS